MTAKGARAAIAFLIVAAAPAAAAPPLVVPEFEPIAPARLSAEQVAAFDTPEADQGVAVDAAHFYPVDNSVIGKYEKESGAFVDRIVLPAHGPIRHMNSCYAADGELLCANSNYPLVPMASSIEAFNAATLDHVRSISLGVLDEGSLTWFDHVDGGWIAGFAHYDGEDGGVGFKDHSFSNVVLFDEEWRRTGGYALPASIVERLAPDAASGGAIGPDGLLYVTGHDRPEMYVLAKPTMGPELVHIATIDIALAGQAFSWDFAAGRRVYAIDREAKRTLAFDVPVVALSDPNGATFR